MRIAVLTMYVRRADAVGLQLIEWVRALHHRGHSVQIFAEQYGPGTPEDVGILTRITSGPKLRESPAWQDLQVADLVICDYPAYYSLAECLRLLSGPRIVFSYHGVTPPALWPDATGRRFLERSRQRTALVHFADLAIARSEFTRQELHHLTGFPLERIAVIPCSVPATPSSPPPAQSHNPPLIISVGRLAANKRPQLLVDALALVRDGIPDASLLLVGDAHGPSHAPVVAQVRARASALGIVEAVHCTGLVDDALLERLYARADLLVSASVHEGFCVPVVEAMARGVPVVAVAAGALPETVDDAGLLVAPDDMPALAEAMRRALQDAPLRQTLVQRGYQHAQRYQPEVVGRQLVELLEGLSSGAIKERVGLPRLSQLAEVATLAAAAELPSPFPAAGTRIPVISALAARLRRWMTSDLLRQVDLVIQRQVTYNRQLAQVLQATDELSAMVSEREAALRARLDQSLPGSPDRSREP